MQSSNADCLCKARQYCAAQNHSPVMCHVVQRSTYGVLYITAAERGSARAAAAAAAAAGAVTHVHAVLGGNIAQGIGVVIFANAAKVGGGTRHLHTAAVAGDRLSAAATCAP
jgi:predicted transcriptional regulator